VNREERGLHSIRVKWGHIGGPSKKIHRGLRMPKKVPPQRRCSLEREKLDGTPSKYSLNMAVPGIGLGGERGSAYAGLRNGENVMREVTRQTKGGTGYSRIDEVKGACGKKRRDASKSENQYQRLICGGKSSNPVN